MTTVTMVLLLKLSKSRLIGRTLVMLTMISISSVIRLVWSRLSVSVKMMKLTSVRMTVTLGASVSLVLTLEDLLLLAVGDLLVGVLGIGICCRWYLCYVVWCCVVTLNIVRFRLSLCCLKCERTCYLGCGVQRFGFVLPLSVV